MYMIPLHTSVLIISASYLLVRLRKPRTCPPVTVMLFGTFGVNFGALGLFANWLAWSYRSFLMVASGMSSASHRSSCPFSEAGWQGPVAAVDGGSSVMVSTAVSLTTSWRSLGTGRWSC